MDKTSGNFVSKTCILSVAEVAGISFLNVYLSRARDFQGKRVNPPYRSSTYMVPSSSEDITRAMRGQLKPLCRNYLGRNVNVYVLISFHSRDVLCTLSCLFVPPGFVGFVLVCLFIIWPFIRFQGVKLSKISQRRQRVQ